MSARILLSRTAHAAARRTPIPRVTNTSSASLPAATLRHHAYGAGLGISLAFGATSAAGLLPPSRKPSSYLFDGPFATTATTTTQDRAFSSKRGGDTQGKKQGGLDPELLSQLSRGSVTGFLAGLLLSVFSKTLVLLGGVAVVLTQVAARYGIDIVHQLKLKQRIGNSKVLSALERDPAFKLSFGFFFAMSAFVGF